MQTRLDPTILATDAGREADAILRSCVHCGFCTATCPTYQLLGDELDGPRGRIVLIKAMLEQNAAGEATREHLDRCLTCRACETTCPSGVRYGRLLDIGRNHLEARVPRPARDRLLRWALRRTVPYPRRFGPLLGAGQLLRPLLPRALRERIPRRQRAPRGAVASGRHSRRVLLLAGCVQQVATPRTNAALRVVLDHLGIEAVVAPAAGCCGALPHHLGAHAESRALARRNVDAWWPEVAAGAEAIVAGASGCGAQLREYGWLLADDPVYAERAAAIADRVLDPAELLAAEGPLDLQVPGAPRVAWQSPCTLQHGMRVTGAVERLLSDAGCSVLPVSEPHLCCGSAGTYSILQPRIAESLRERKLAALTAAGPERIVTANVGCQLHLGARAEVPVQHWAELLAEGCRVHEGSMRRG